MFIAVETAGIPLGNVKEFRTHVFVLSLPLPTLLGVKFTNLHSYIKEASTISVQFAALVHILLSCRQDLSSAAYMTGNGNSKINAFSQLDC